MRYYITVTRYSIKDKLRIAKELSRLYGLTSLSENVIRYCDVNQFVWDSLDAYRRLKWVKIPSTVGTPVKCPVSFVNYLGQM